MTSGTELDFSGPIFAKKSLNLSEIPSFEEINSLSTDISEIKPEFAFWMSAAFFRIDQSYGLPCISDSITF